MCTHLSKFPLLSDGDKKHVCFHTPYVINGRNQYKDFNDFKTECLKAQYGGSSYSILNKFIKSYKVVDFISVPCGICSECLRQRAMDWATRIVLESKLYKHNYFVTLTYDEEHLPSNHMLVPDEISKFNKKLKTTLERLGLNSHFRFYSVGEYGGATARPHYHTILFNLDLPENDLVYYKTSSNGDRYYNSKLLSKVWSKGFVVVGEVTVGSACYVARYCDKKKVLTKAQKEKLKEQGIVPEFNRMSRRPGIGADFLEDMERKLDNGGLVQLPHGQLSNVPQYYVKKYKDTLSDDALLLLNAQRDYNASIKLSRLLSDAEKADLDLEEYVDSIQKKKTTKRYV